MIIKKKPKTFSEYALEISYGQLEAIKNALALDHSDPISDELYAELEWYLANIPGPGEDEADLKKAEEAAASHLDEPEAGGASQASADARIPKPEGARSHAGAAEPPSAEPEEAPPADADTELDRRLPPPPSE